jgi:hypothetical protein
MPPPKSPSEKPPSQSRRPGPSGGLGGLRRSSSDASITQGSSESSKHGTRAGHSSLGKIKDPPSDPPSAAKIDVKMASKPPEVDIKGRHEFKIQMPESLHQRPMFRRRVGVESEFDRTAPTPTVNQQRGSKSESRIGDMPQDVSPEEV